MIVFTLKAAGSYERDAYGLTHESAEVCDMTGPGIHNANHAHRVKVFGDRVVLQPQVIVIAAAPVEQPVNVGSVRIGDTVTLRLVGSGRAAGRHFDSLWRVEAKPLHNPHLVKVQDLVEG